MVRTRRRYLATVAGAVALAGCQSGTDEGATPTDDAGESTPTDTATPAATTAGGNGGGTAPTVQVRAHDDLGAILVDDADMTLYMFDSDSKGSGESSCTGGCLDAWPALTVSGEPVAGDGVEAELTTFQRSDGGTQVTANGWPLYYYVSDSAPGDASGQGVNDVWWVLDPTGAPITGSGGAASPTETDDGGLGY